VPQHLQNSEESRKKAKTFPQNNASEVSRKKGLNLNRGNQYSTRITSHRLNLRQEKQRVQTATPITEFGQSNQRAPLNQRKQKSKASRENLWLFCFSITASFFLFFFFSLFSVCDDIYRK